MHAEGLYPGVLGSGIISTQVKRLFIENRWFLL